MSSAALATPRVSSSVWWLVWRELAVITRTTAFWAATTVYVTALSLFLLVWGDGVPAMSGTLLDQFGAVQMAVLAAVLPWAAFRAVTGSRRELVLIAELACCPPAQVVMTRYLSTTLALFAMVLCALPMSLVAAQIASAGLDRLLRDFPPLLALCASAAALVSLATAADTGRVTSWAFATLALVAVSALTSAGIAVPLLIVLLTIALAGSVAARANRTMEIVA